MKDYVITFNLLCVKKKNINYNDDNKLKFI